MSIHDDIQELIPAYVLDALDPPDKAKAEAHLASCDVCAGVLGEYRELPVALAYSARAATLPENLKSRTMLRAVKAAAKPTRVAGSRLWPALPRLNLAGGLAAAAFLLALMTIAWTAWQSLQFARELSAQRELMTVVAYAQGSPLVIRGTESSPNAEGRLFVDPDAQVAALVTSNLSPLSSGHEYHVWLTDKDGKKTSGGTFTVDAEGNGWLLVRAPSTLNNYKQVGVTPEPMGATAPSAKPVLLALLAPQ